MTRRFSQAHRDLAFANIRAEYRQRLQDLPDPRSAEYKLALADLNDWRDNERRLVLEQYCASRGAVGRPRKPDPYKAWAAQRVESEAQHRLLLDILGTELYGEATKDDPL